MTVPTDISRSGPYAGAGTTGPFTVGFRFLANSHLQVIRTSGGIDTTLVLDTDYTVSGAGGASGTVTLAVALAVGQSLTIIRDVPFTQEADYVAGDSFPAQSHEDALDLVVMQTQQLKDGLDRSLTLAPTAVGASTELPAPESLSLIGWNATGDALQNYDATALGVAIATASWRTDVFNGTGVQTAFVLTQDPGVASNCDVSVSGVQQVADVNFSYTPATQTITFLTGAPASGTGNVAVRYGSALAAGTVASTSITDSTVAGRAVLTAANAAAQRTAIGAAETGANSTITSLTGLTSPVAEVRQIQPISASVAANALTISASALSLEFRSATLTSGAVSFVEGTPANLVISSGSTLGTVSGQQSDIVVLAINNAGTIELAAVNIAGGNDLSETGVISTTAEGGAGAADSANVIYSTTARTNVAYRVIGLIRSTQTTAGTWATAPSLVQGMGGNALDSMQSLGYGQTWQNVTGSRASATTYYNTTGKSIMVAVTSPVSGSSHTPTVNGVAIGTNGNNASSGSYFTSFIVPPGASYLCAYTVGTWYELR